MDPVSDETLNEWEKAAPLYIEDKLLRENFLRLINTVRVERDVRKSQALVFAEERSLLFRYIEAIKKSLAFPVVIEESDVQD